MWKTSYQKRIGRKSRLIQTRIEQNNGKELITQIKYNFKVKCNFGTPLKI